MKDNLQHMLSPRSIVVLGASADFNKLSGRVLKALIDKGFDGPIYPVNPRYEEIAGMRCYPDVGAVPPDADLAIVALPAPAVADALRGLAARGVKAAVVFSSGFSEIGDDGAAHDAAMQSAILETGIRVLGPNCLGFYNAHARVFATFSQVSAGDIPANPVALVSQSGALATMTATMALRRGFGFGQLVATGNEADVTTVDVIATAIDNDAIRVVACFAEGIRDGRALIGTARRAMAAGKPLILCKIGRTPAGARAIASHTGALAGETEVFEGVARQCGIVRAPSDTQLLNYAVAFTHCPSPGGNRLAILTRSGGAGALMADRAEECGLRLATLDEGTTSALREILPAFASTANPVDMTAQGIVDQTITGRVLERLMADPQVDVGVVWVGVARDEAPMIEAFTGATRHSDKPICICWPGASQDALRQLGGAGVAVFTTPEDAVDAAAALCSYAEARRTWLTTAGDAAKTLPAPALPAAAGAAGTLDSIRLLTEAGVPVVPAGLARDAEEAVRLAGNCGYPVALKIESPDILHKTEAGGVRLGLSSDAAVREAAGAILAAARTYDPAARILGVTVQPMAAPGVELALGVRNDPVFGPVVMAALGGIFIEVLKDAAFRAAPVNRDEALDMLGELRGTTMLDGARGALPADRGKLADMIVSLSRFAAAAGPRLQELDLNPVFAGPDGAVAVDTLLVLAGNG